MSDTIISITVNGTALQGILQPSAATASLMAALPLDLPFKDYGGQEKIAALPEPLALEGMPSGGSAPPGTIGYYVPDQALVLYYESVDHYPGIIPIGTFDDIPTIRGTATFTATVAVETPVDPLEASGDSMKETK